VPNSGIQRLGFKPLGMSKPARNSRPDGIVTSARTFFATTKTSQGAPLLQSERNAMLLVDVLRSYMAAGKFRIHDFVVMPNHLHVLLTVGRDMTIEKAILARQKAAGAKALDSSRYRRHD
jgi:REP element-mobilizing transposase RayT